jgi:hypothetical protein
MPKAREGEVYKKKYDEEAMKKALECVRNKSEEERTLVTWIEDCARKGFPKRKEDIQISV